MSERVGFIGLGNMGRGLASNLCRKGFSVTAFDVRPEPLEHVRALGARTAKTSGDVAAASDVVITCLPNTAAVEDVALGPDGVLARMPKGGLFVETSTVDPVLTDRLAADAARRGIAFVDAPLGRLSVHADRGESLFMVGAGDADFARVKPLLDAMGTTIHHCGGVGAGIRTKLVNNYLAIVSCAFNAEAIALAQKFGLSLEKTLDVIHGTTATNGQLKMAWAGKVFKGDTEPGFAIDLAHKDLTLIVNAANAFHVPMPIGAVAREAFSSARTQGHGAQDFSAMGDIHCDLAHVARPRLS
jgi:4-hydroxybutyrate dehydrogenase / sulfolactaldehyde 3-reductase